MVKSWVWVLGLAGSLAAVAPSQAAMPGGGLPALAPPAQLAQFVFDPFGVFDGDRDQWRREREWRRRNGGGYHSDDYGSQRRQRNYGGGGGWRQDRGDDGGGWGHRNHGGDFGDGRRERYNADRNRDDWRFHPDSNGRYNGH